VAVSFDLLAPAIVVAACVLLFVWPRAWWAIVAAAGALLLLRRSGRLHRRYDADVTRRAARLTPQPILSEEDVARLPPAVQRYLRGAGVIGRPRVQALRATMHGRIRSGPDAPWMPFRAEQVNFFDEPARFFYMNASLARVPIAGLHRYEGAEATMLVRALGLVPVARAGGPAMTKAETVTLFNDMCLLAPATLISPAIIWEGGDASIVRAAFTNAGHTIRAELHFDDQGAIANFVSDDRLRGNTNADMHPARWSTPVSGPRDFHGVHLASRGEAWWHEPDREFAYIELTIDDVSFDTDKIKSF